MDISHFCTKIGIASHQRQLIKEFIWLIIIIMVEWKKFSNYFKLYLTFPADL